MPSYFWDGGIIEAETTTFARQYLAERPLLQKVFDPHANDIGTYQARELSYLVDCADAHVLKRVLGRAPRFLIPFSALLAAFLTVLVFSVGAGKVAPLVRPVTATLVLLLYLTNHVYVVTTAVYYRSAKPLLAPVLLATLFSVTYVLARAQSRTPGTRIVSGPFVVVFVLLCVMSLLDRQGFFYALTMLAGLALWYRYTGGRRDLLDGAIAAVALMVLYNFLFGPLIVMYVNGYWPSFEYQNLPAVHLLTHPRHLIQAIELMAQSTQLLVGAFPWWVYASLGIGLGLWTLRPFDATSGTLTDQVRSGWKRRLREPAFLLVGIAVVSQAVMFALMIIRHPPIWDFHDHRLWYYPLPFQMFATFGLLLLLQARARHWRGMSHAAVNAALAAMIAGNLLSLPNYRDVMLASRWFPGVHAQSGALKASFERRRPDPALSEEYRVFYDISA